MKGLYKPFLAAAWNGKMYRQWFAGLLLNSKYDIVPSRWISYEIPHERSFYTT